MEITLGGKVILITGGSRGIGRAIAIECAKAGAEIVLVARNLTKLQEVQAECLKYTKKVSIAQVDLENGHEIYDMVLKVANEFGKINCLICNAGVLNTRGKKFWEIDTSEWEETFRINLFANVDLVKAALPYLRKEINSKIIFISSNIGIRPAAFSSDYCASKAALITLCQSLAVELAPYKITANVICPGPVRTDMLSVSASVEEAIKNYVPLKRIGEPEDIAGLAVFLCSDYANWITGSIFTIDGGALLPYSKS